VREGKASFNGIFRALDRNCGPAGRQLFYLNQDGPTFEIKKHMNKLSNSNPRAGKIFAGVILLAVGVVMLLQKSGYHFPLWFITWEMILIAVGLFIGFRSNFRHPAWFIMVTIGALFLAEDYIHEFHARPYLWPILIIFLGLWMIFGRQRSRSHPSHYNSFNPGPETALPPPDYSYQPARDYNQPAGDYTSGGTPEPALADNPVSSLDYLDVTAVLGGSKKIIVSKNFQGGEILTFMGGTEINLVQADIQGRAVIDVTQVMGGIKLVVPANWTVISEMAVIMGGIDDKRLLHAPAPDKILVIKGTSLMGGMEINSY
jgi:predicted membrane protein